MFYYQVNDISAVIHPDSYDDSIMFRSARCANSSNSSVVSGHPRPRTGRSRTSTRYTGDSSRLVKPLPVAPPCGMSCWNAVSIKRLWDHSRLKNRTIVNKARAILFYRGRSDCDPKRYFSLMMFQSHLLCMIIVVEK